MANELLKLELEHDTGENKDWFLLNPRMKKERADKLRAYARDYFEPALEKFPELKGKVYLALRKEGWFADYKPVLNIIVREEHLEIRPEWRIRITTAHELMHLLQFENKVGIDKKSLGYEKQATFLTFTRGFAYDFLKSYPKTCMKDSCDHKFKVGYFFCDKIFNNCCKSYNEDTLQTMAALITSLAEENNTWELQNYDNLILNALIQY